LALGLLAATGCDDKDKGAVQTGAGGSPSATSSPSAASFGASGGTALSSVASAPAMRDAVAPTAPAPGASSTLLGGRLFDNRLRDLSGPGGLGGSLGSGVYAGAGNGRSLATFAGYTAPAGPAGLHTGAVPAPDTNATNPIGARIEHFMGLARAAKNYCYQAVANVLEAAGVIKIPQQYAGRACEFATAFDQNVSGVQSRFQEADPMAAYPFRRGTVLVWGDLNCSVSGSKAGRASGHIEIVRKLNCSDPTHPSRASCPSITDRHFATVDRTYPELSVFASRKHEKTGAPCVRAFEPRASTTSI
jgi:hypothetical protein